MLYKRENILKITGANKVTSALELLLSSKKIQNLLKKDLKFSEPKNILFHGSPKLLKGVIPNISNGGMNKNKKQDLVYATDNPEYAIFLAIINLKDKGIASVTFTGQRINLSVDINFIDGASKIGDGYVYVFSRDSFLKQNNHEFTTTKTIKPLFYINVKPEDLISPIKIKLN